MNDVRTIVHRTAIMNEVWGELIVTESRNDMGKAGYLLCYERNDPERGGIAYRDLFWYQDRQTAIDVAEKYKTR